MNKKHLGTNLDGFLAEERILDAAQATAAKRVIAFQIAQEMKRRKLTKSGNGPPDENQPRNSGALA